MKVLSISTDRMVFEKGSAVRSRLLEYGGLIEELHVIVFAKKSLGLHDEVIEPNIFLYPTNSISKFFYIASAILFALKLRRRGVMIDVVTTQDPFEAGFAGYIIARIFKSHLHLQIHTDVMSPYFRNESMVNRIRVMLAKFLIPRAHAIRVVSMRIKKSIESIVKKNTSITVLPITSNIENTNHASEPDLRKKYPQFNKVILVASRLAQEKNIDMALDAMRAVIKKYPQAGLVIVGEGTEETHLKSLVREYSLEKNVLFESWQKDLSPYYRSADIFLLTSNYEGYGMTVVEALSAGCPVIMTDVGCAGEVVKDNENGLIVPVGDSQALVRAMESLISNNVRLTVKIPVLSSKEEYLATYKKSWDDHIRRDTSFLLI
ncbi:MAG: glycosyltransferase family 4 protein [bacterium]|nr:glycosyltransferase family 4 protein [bacterium]